MDTTQVDDFVDYQKVQDAVTGVWQSHPDAVLSTLTRRQFAAQVEGLDLTDSEMEEAWYEFAERQDRVFG